MALPLPDEWLCLSAWRTYCPDTPDLLPKMAFPRSFFAPKNSLNPFSRQVSLFTGLASFIVVLIAESLH